MQHGQLQTQIIHSALKLSHLFSSHFRMEAAQLHALYDELYSRLNEQKRYKNKEHTDNGPLEEA